MVMEQLLGLLPEQLQTLVRIGPDSFATTHLNHSGDTVHNVWEYQKVRDGFDKNGWVKVGPTIFRNSGLTRNVPCHWNGTERIAEGQYS